MQAEVNVTRARSDPGGLWDTLLEGGLGLVALAGAILVLAPDLAGLAWLNRPVAAAFFPSGVPEGADRLRHWLYAVEGATLVAFGALGLAVARVGFRRREPWARNALALAIGLWFVPDTAVSAVHGVWANVALNVGIAMVLLLPIAAAWRRFPTHDAPRSMEVSEPPDLGGTRVDWDPPRPRGGWRGSLDRFFGPGTTRAEYLLQVIAIAGLTTLIVTLGPNGAAAGFTVLQWLVVVVLAIDISGGIVTNATSPAKRWYHREGLRFRDQFGFVALHGAHLILFTTVLGGMTWAEFALFYGLLLISAVVLLRVRLYLQRPLALTFYAGVLLLSLTMIPPATGFGWFLPLFFLKLEVSHLVREAPFRPARSLAPWTATLTLVLLGLSGLAVPASAQTLPTGKPAEPPDAHSLATGYWSFRWSRLGQQGCRLAGLGFQLGLGDGTRVGVAGYGTARAARLDSGEARIAYAGVRVEHAVVRWNGWFLAGAVLAGGGRFWIEGDSQAKRTRGVALVEPELLLGRQIGHLTITAGVARRWIPEKASGLSDGEAGGWTGILQLGVR